MSANEELQSASVDYAEINQAKVGISAHSLPVMLAILQTSGIDCANWPLGSSTLSVSNVLVCGAYAKNAWGIVRTWNSPCGGAFPHPSS